MLKTCAVAAAFIATAATAQAKEPPRRLPEREKPVAERHDWSGFYAGVNGGAGTTSARSTGTGMREAPSGVAGRPRP